VGYDFMHHPLIAFPPPPLSSTHLLLANHQYRAKNDHWNGIAGGFCAGATLARNSGPWGCMLGGMGFAAFSAVIDMWMRKTPSEEP
jgi:hypothetical protein